MTHDEVFDMTQQLINQRIYERNHPKMKTAIIKNAQGKVVAMLVQQPELSDENYEEIKLALLLTLANNAGLQLTLEETAD